MIGSDKWRCGKPQTTPAVRSILGVLGTIPDTLGKPALEAIDETVKHVKAAKPTAERILSSILQDGFNVYSNRTPDCLMVKERFSL